MNVPATWTEAAVQAEKRVASGADPRSADRRSVDARSVDPRNVDPRLRVLWELDLLDSEPEPEFDDLVEIAAAICEVPIGLISLVDEKRQWFKARIGLALQESPIEHAFCVHTIRAGDLMVVEDATKDERFAANPFVTGEAGIRFYAGVPISCGSNGPLLGTLCVLDERPKELSAMQISALRVLARQVSARFDLRSKRRALEKALAEAEEMKRRFTLSEAMFRSFMNNGPFHAFVKSAYGSFLYYNEPLATYLGLSETGFLGKRDGDLWPKDDVPRYRKHDLEVLRTGALSIREEDVVDRGGERHRWRTYKFPCVSVDGQRAVGAISQDVTAEVEQTLALESSRRELEEANTRLHQLAETDALTGVPNRRSFDERLTLEWGLASRHRREISVVLLDIDHFKRRNDTYGHAAGDLVLQQLACVIKTGLREHDLFARYGGEEFALLLPDTTKAEARIVVDRLLSMLRTAAWEHEPVTASFGIASFGSSPGHGACNDPQQFISFADEALYAAKRTGRDRAVVYGEYPQIALTEVEAEPVYAA